MTVTRARHTLRECTPACHAESVNVPTATAALEPLFHYAVVRRDLPLGILAAQILHAGGESSPGNLPDGTHAVVLAVPGEAELAAVGHRLTLAGIPHVRIIEDSPPYSGQLMAIGVSPGPRKEVHRCLSSLPLLR